MAGNRKEHGRMTSSSGYSGTATAEQDGKRTEALWLNGKPPFKEYSCPTNEQLIIFIHMYFLPDAEIF